MKRTILGHGKKKISIRITICGVIGKVYPVSIMYRISSLLTGLKKSAPSKRRSRPGSAAGDENRRDG